MMTTQTATPALDQPTLLDSRYQLLSKMGDGGMGTVYSARDRLTGDIVALKEVLVNLQRLRSADQTPGDPGLLLAQEFKVLASLRHPHIVSVLDYGFDRQGHPYYTMTLLEGARHLTEVARECDFAGKLDLISQALQALAYLHRRGIVHRDLKPRNILVDVHGQLAVVDFGLAVTHDERAPGSGTIAYTAPEVLRGQKSTAQSDLWSMGVIIYELFAGQRPFDSQLAVALIQKIIRQTLDLSTLASVKQLGPTIERLLAKSPADRFSSAEAVIAALAQASDQALPLETPATRESFLQASEFIGRDSELRLLNEALLAAAQSRGSVWLVGGESGVGKSRLLDELQTQALLRGALVLRGQAVAQGGTPYQIWRDAIRRLLLQTEMADYELAVLKLMLPDIGKLLDRDVPDLPQIDAHSRDLRLWPVLEHLFDQKHLTVLLLEDLHWADESLFILDRLFELAQRSPLLIIGTYRDDERPTLPAEFPQAQHIKLARLSADSVAQLSASMLGEAGRSNSILELLERETEGNVFFIVEVVRALAEESGGLAHVGQKPLPDHVFAGGIRAVIQRRLDKVPETARRLLISAAIAGRELDLNILHSLLPDLDLDDWLQHVATVIEVQDNRYRFAYDKLREGVLLGLTPEERRQRHAEIAQTIQRTYPDSPEQYAALAYHWGQAQVAAQIAQYATLAGEQALRSGGYRDAIEFFEQALAVSEQAQLDRTQLSSLYYQLGDAYWGQSDMLRSKAWHIKTLRLLGFSVPQDRLQLLLGSLKPMISHFWRRLTHRQHTAQHPEEQLIAAGALHQITQVSYHDAALVLAIYCLFNGVEAADQSGNSAQAIRIQVRFYGTLGVAMGEVALHPFARWYFKLSEQRVNVDPLLETQAWYSVLYSIYLAGRGRWQQAMQLVETSMQHSKTAGNLRLWVEALEFQIYMYCQQGRYTEALAAVDSAGQVTIRDGHVQAISRFHIARTRLLFLLGRVDEARQQYFDNETAIEASFSLGAQTVTRIAATSVLIDICARNQDWQTALSYADLFNQLIRAGESLSFILATEASASIALYLTLWEKQKPGPYRQLSQTMLRVFHRKITWFHDTGAPVEWVYRCWYHWLDGNEQRARAAAARAIQAAKTFQMPYYEAAAHYHLGRFMPESYPERAEHLKTASAIFDQLGCTADAQFARETIQ